MSATTRIDSGSADGEQRAVKGEQRGRDVLEEDEWVTADMIAMTQMNVSAILSNLRHRYALDQIYVSAPVWVAWQRVRALVSLR
jgi:myosin heavy subunit